MLILKQLIFFSKYLEDNLDERYIQCGLNEDDGNKERINMGIISVKKVTWLTIKLLHIYLDDIYIQISSR